MFWVCAADANGDRLVGTEELLSPGPGELEYPTAPAGAIVETTDGNVVKQQPSLDPRRRAWIWPLMPAYLPKYRRFVQRLESLVSRTRREQGLSPYVYLKDTATDAFRRWEFAAGTATSATTTTLTDTTKSMVVDRYVGATIEIQGGTGAGQRRTIIANSAIAFTVDRAWGTVPTGATYRVQSSVNDWVRVRVLEVSKKISGRSGVTYTPVRLEFVVADASWNDLG